MCFIVGPRIESHKPVLLTGDGWTCAEVLCGEGYYALTYRRVGQNCQLASVDPVCPVLPRMVHPAQNPYF
jgi:hypothetical protein